MARRCGFCRQKIDIGNYCDDACRRAQIKETNIDAKVNKTRRERAKEARREEEAEERRRKRRGR